ncbi:heme exporter protein CcmD [Phyllobacterium sp. BT25]|uniref:Heme exporter protein D n=1 Tax=Phyllobacterium pellucidum TaxID=2740464 RepID=A0A849VRR2_9HYPH|nr:heme exporter protein CcmD [Phyllobacterium pellucidum]NTS32662.1 heme exporter protein CcmD [Phyllobacterium pellucidum]
MSSHAGFVIAAYGVSFIALAGLIGWVFIDQRLQNRALRQLESRGVRRRSEGKGAQP